MNTIGLNSASHDAAACLVKDGKVCYAAAEERFSRKTHDRAFPVSAIKEALASTNTALNEISAVSIGWSTPLTAARYQLQGFLRSGKLGATPYFVKGVGETIWSGLGSKKAKHLLPDAKISYCDHHLAHALSAYCCSGFENATVVVVDGRGAFESTSIWQAKNGVIEPIEILHWPNSLGLFYAKITGYLGFTPLSDEWKVMGLAAYGKPGIDLSAILDTSSHPHRVNHTLINCGSMSDISGVEKVLGPGRKPDEPITERHKDIAFAAQALTEHAMINCVKTAISRTGIKDLCLAGGVALNCKANGYIANLPEVDRIFVQPASSDEGTAIGAAFYPYLLQFGKVPCSELKHAYLGSSFDNQQIEAELVKYKLKYEKQGRVEEAIADLLVEGKILGRFNGAMEFGPRALGNRSIIADPRREEMKGLVNNSVKYREDWRPFAPSILKEHYHEYFEAKGLSPFMILSFELKPEKRGAIPAAVHVDNTGRPQTVDSEVNPSYAKIIDSFYKKTGVPVILNTSFNLKGEPIVRSPYDAIRTFFTSGLDVLAIGDYLVYKS